MYVFDGCNDDGDSFLEGRGASFYTFRMLQGALHCLWYFGLGTGILGHLFIGFRVVLGIQGFLLTPVTCFIIL